MKHLEPNDFRDYITDDFELDSGKICQDVNSGYNPSKEIPFSVGLLRSMLRTIPTQDFSSAFVSNFLTHTPFVFRDDTLSRDDV